MAFGTLLGNDRLKKNLEESLAKGRISHFYLISGPAGSGKRTLANLLAAAILCREGNRPCLGCHVCRRVLENNHPDFITVEDPEHKTTAVKIVRQFREDVFIRPNESDYKIYLFPQELGLEGQNALLKILEEPPKYGVFILLSDNPDKLLPTVRSRCTELKMQAIPGELLKKQLQKDFPQATAEDLEAALRRSGGFLGQARELLSSGSEMPPQTQRFVRAFAGRNALELTEVLVPMEKWKRDALTEILNSWAELLEEALTCRAGETAVSSMARALSQSRSTKDLLQALKSVKKAREYALSNVSPGAVCGWLAWSLR